MDFYSLLKEISEKGKDVRPRGFLTKELLGEKLVISEYNLFSTPIHRSFESVSKYLWAETAWYMSGDKSPDKIIKNARMWHDIKNPDGTINSNYGHRVFYRKNTYGVTGFEFAKSCLLADKESRNAIIPYNEPDLCWLGNKDFICTQHQRFLIRNEELICFVSLRSSDAIFGLYFNCPWWSLVHQQMLLSLLPKYPNLKLGRIEVFIESAHIYERHFGLAEKIISSPQEKYFVRWLDVIPLNKTFEWYADNLDLYYTVEKVFI